MRLLISSLALGLGLWGCATQHAAAFDVSGVQGPLRLATTLGADKNPDAALYLKFSRTELDRARQLSNAGDAERADGMTRRAKADAELALAIAKRAVADSEAVQAHEMSP